MINYEITEDDWVPKVGDKVKLINLVGDKVNNCDAEIVFVLGLTHSYVYVFDTDTTHIICNENIERFKYC